MKRSQNFSLNEEIYKLLVRVLGSGSFSTKQRELLIHYLSNRKQAALPDNSKLAASLGLDLKEFERVKGEVLQILLEKALADGRGKDFLEFIGYLMGEDVRVSKQRARTLGFTPASMSIEHVDIKKSRREFPKDWRRDIDSIAERTEKDLKPSVIEIPEVVTVPWENLPRDDVAMLFDEDVPLEKYGGKTPTQLKREYLNRFARELFESSSSGSLSNLSKEFEFSYDDGQRLGSEIRQLRTYLGLTQLDLESYGINRQYLVEAEVGRAGKRLFKPGPDTLYRILKAMSHAYSNKQTKSIN